MAIQTYASFASPTKARVILNSHHPDGVIAEAVGKRHARRPNLVHTRIMGWGWDAWDAWLRLGGGSTWQQPLPLRTDMIRDIIYLLVAALIVALVVSQVRKKISFRKPARAHPPDPHWRLQ